MAIMQQKIVLIEDDLNLCQIYKVNFEKIGIETIIVEDGKDALRLIKSEKPDLVLLDLMLPYKSGFEILEEIKKDQEIKNIPVIVLTNLGRELDRETCRKLGAVDYFIKAESTIKQVIDKVQEYLRRA